MIAQIDKLYTKIGLSRVLPRIMSYLLFEGRPLTTKGRWINPLVFGLYAAVKKLPILKAVTQPIYIVGTGRSGTTILGVVLSMHKDVGFLNEPKALWHSVYPYEDLIGSYTNEPARYRMDEKHVTATISNDLIKMYAAYMRLTGAHRVVDKYPELIFRSDFVRCIFPDARFIFLARNGWDTCVSINRWSQRLGTTDGSVVHDWWGKDDRKWSYLVDQLVPEHEDLAPHRSSIRHFDNHLDRAAVEWIVSMREGLRVSADNPDNVLRVDYEKLTADPRAWLERILRFCELPEDKRCLEYGCKTLRPVSPRKHFDMNPLIIEPFMETQTRLGY